MTIDAALAALAAVPVLVDEVRGLRRELAELRAIVEQAGDEWVTQAEHARANGISVDTTARLIAAGKLEVKEFGRTPLVDGSGNPLVDKNGQPRFRRTLRVRLARTVSESEVRRIASEMVAAS